MHTTKSSINIQSVKGKGSMLSEPLILLDNKKIKSLLSENIKSLVSIEILETTHSTNDYLKTILEKKSIIVCLAEQQTKGKGRLGRQWHSPFAQNIYFSCHYPFHKDVSKLTGLSLIIALATISALRVYCGENNFVIKWPNDILVDAKKLAGILVEINTDMHGLTDAIIGIGINCNMSNTDGDTIDQPWTSLQQVTGKSIDRNKLVATLITALIKYIQQFEVSGLVHFRGEWKTNDYLLGKSVTVISGGNNELTGIATGINDQGHLLVKLSDGTIHAISSGDATLKKL